jgi:hypothetical protein
MYLNFHIKTIGSISIEEGEVLDFNNKYHNFHYIHTDIFNKGVKLEYISGVKNGGYNIKDTTSLLYLDIRKIRKDI